MPPPVDPKPLDALGVLRIYTACPLGPKVLLLDVRPYKVFKKSHLMGAFCVRLSANGAALLDYSQSSYSAPWSSDCWWGRPVVVYGPPGLSRDHPVIAFLAREGRVASLQYHREGFEAVEASHPYLATASVKQGCIKHYPSIIIDRELYLGDWADAEATERLQELGIKRIVTIHNHPENLRPPPGVRHLKLELPDVEGADISQHFNPSYEFIDEGRRTRQPTLVHCGAGVSRSAALVASYLMRARTWSAQRAVDHVKGARSMVQPNDGFWRVLCALEEGLGVPPQERSDPNATTGFAGADVPVQLAKDAAGEKVGVVVLGAGGQQPQHQQQQQQQQRGGEGRRDDRPRGSRRSRSRSRDRDEDRRHQDGGRGRRSRSRSRSRDRYRRRSRSRDRDRGGDRDRAERDRNRGRRSRSRSRSRDRDRRGERNGDASARPAAAAAAAAAPADPVAAAVATAAAAGKKGWLLVVGVSKPEGSVGQLILGPLGPSSRVVFGRSPAPACDVTCEHASISRQHAALSVDGATGAVSLTDLGSAHGTQLGDMWVKPQLARPVALGAPIRFGASTRCYRVERVERVA